MIDTIPNHEGCTNRSWRLSHQVMDYPFLRSRQSLKASFGGPHFQHMQTVGITSRPRLTRSDPREGLTWQASTASKGFQR
jgi:hypothetical protein